VHQTAGIFKSTGKKTLGEVFHLSVSIIKPYTVCTVAHLIVEEKNKIQTQTAMHVRQIALLFSLITAEGKIPFTLHLQPPTVTCGSNSCYGRPSLKVWQHSTEILQHNKDNDEKFHNVLSISCI